MNKIKALLRLPAPVRRMLPEALALSAWYRFSMLHRPFATLAKGLGEYGAETGQENEDVQTVRYVSRAVTAVCRRTPWQSKCLVEALTARKMLTRRGISCTLYMGARRNDENRMQAHAWLRSGSLFVVGGHGKDEYAVTSFYATARRKV